MKLYSIRPYKNPEIKEIVRKSKNLENQALNLVAHDLYAGILDIIKSNITAVNKFRDTGEHGLNILILHSPSSSFCRRQKKSDHMAEILKNIKYEHGLRKGGCRLKLYAHEHAFIINFDKTNSQHHKSRAERITESESRFKIISPYLKYIKSNYSTGEKIKFDFIFILDDVLTTGSTLYYLSSLIEKYFEIGERDIKGNIKRNFHTDSEQNHWQPQVICLAYCH